MEKILHHLSHAFCNNRHNLLHLPVHLFNRFLHGGLSLIQAFLHVGINDFSILSRSVESIGDHGGGEQKFFHGKILPAYKIVQ